MARYFNHKTIELLAPAGTFEILQEIVKTNCDAIYFGGRILNMRMIRKGYNLSDEEIIEGIKLAHRYNKKAYITLNNLNSQDDIEEAREYLVFLANEAKPDAIIVQDMSILQLMKELNIKLNVHASVMMNVHNIEMVEELKKLGVSRAVVSRDFSLDTVRYFKANVPKMEIEYFTHGDMCFVHGSQCYFSSLLFGMSSNRGRCLKPCRWWYQIKKDQKVYDTKFPLAVKDMCMYQFLPEMIEAGVTSFKIEGRMREKEFIVNLVNVYGNALDRYIKDPLNYERNKDFNVLYESRKRDFSTAYAFGNPGLSNINTRYEGTGKIYSSGRMFSKPTVEKENLDEKVIQLKDTINSYKKNPKQLELAVKVNNYEQAQLCIEKKVDIIYLSGNVYKPDQPWSVSQIDQLCKIKGSTKIILGTPKIIDQFDFERYAQLLDINKFNLDGISVSNIGSLAFFKQFGYELYGDYSLNIYNHLAIKYYQKYNLKQVALSIELPVKDLCAVVNQSPIKTEVVSHGLVDVMHTELDLYENTNVFDSIGEEDNRYVENNILVLKNEAGEYPVYKDDRNRCHIHNTKEINLLPIINDLASIGVDVVRIEGQIYSNVQLEDIITVYQNVITSKNIEAQKELKPYFAGFTLGALYHEVK